MAGRPVSNFGRCAPIVLAAVFQLLALAGAGAACAADAGAARPAAGGEKSAKTASLEAGARLLQLHTPAALLDIYLVGFHPMKDHPDQQMEAHHFCHQVNEDLAQCAVFDGNGPSARLNGIEYIISEKLFQTLPAEERPYWHPHNAEILSGQLIAPGIPEPAEKALMKQKINSYGKTWHLWNTGMNGTAGDALPLGAPALAWSFNHDGELAPAMLQRRDQALRVSSERKRQQRADLRPLAHPQAGVEALRAAFPHASDIPGVTGSRDLVPAR